MDKFLTLKFFKSIDFETKRDGMAFIDKIAKVKLYIKKLNVEVEDFVDTKLQELEKYMSKFDGEKKEYMEMLKQRNSEQKKEKVNLKNRLTREELKEEIRREMLLSKYSEMLPEGIEVDPELTELYQAITMKLEMKKLSKDEKKELEILKPKVEKLITSRFDIIKRLKELTD